MYHLMYPMYMYPFYVLCIIPCMILCNMYQSGASSCVSLCKCEYIILCIILCLYYISIMYHPAMYISYNQYHISLASRIYINITHHRFHHHPIPNISLNHHQAPKYPCNQYFPLLYHYKIFHIILKYIRKATV